MKSQTDVNKALSNAFHKPAAHFKAKQERKLEYEDKLHRIYQLHKQDKIGSSDDRSKATWIEIHNETIKRENQSRLNQIMVLSGEFLRFLDINNLPKYRILTDEQGTYPISKEIEHATEFFQYFEKNIYAQYKWTMIDHKWHACYLQNDFKEGMGRNTLGSMYLGEGDFHFGNAFIDQQGYYKTIDHDRKFCHITRLFHTDTNKANPILTHTDWQDLPIKKYYQVTNNWQWNNPQVLPYAKKLMKDEKFINEKYFSTLKLIITDIFQRELVDTHIENKRDKLDILSYLNIQRLSLSSIAEQSEVFKKYLQEHGMDALTAIIFEMNEFFKKNPHYVPADQEQAMHHWQNIINSAIENFRAHLNLQKQPIDLTEIEKLKQFALNLYQRDVSQYHQLDQQLARVEYFYAGQKMKTYCYLTNHVRKELQKNFEKTLATPLMETETPSKDRFFSKLQASKKRKTHDTKNDNEKKNIENPKKKIK